MRKYSLYNAKQLDGDCMRTTDLMDAYEDAIHIAEVANFKRYGRSPEFGGEIVTVRCFEDNTKAKKLLETPKGPPRKNEQNTSTSPARKPFQKMRRLSQGRGDCAHE